MFKELNADRLMGIIDESGDGILLLEPIRNPDNSISDFSVLYCNRYAVEVGQINSGYEGKTLLQLLPHLKNSGQFALHQQVANTGEPIRYETTFKTQDRQDYGWFIVSLTRVHGAVISRFTDISVHKQHQQQIEEQHDLLHSILDASLSAVIACEAIGNEAGAITDLRITKVNRAFTLINGIAAANAEGNNFLSLFPHTKTVGLFDHYCQVVKTGKGFQTEMYYCAEGIDGWFEIVAVKRGGNGLVISFTDISHSKKLQDHQERSANYLQQMIDVAPTGIFTMSPVWDDKGQIIDFRFSRVNRTLASYVGQEPEALIGGYHDQWFPGYKTNGVFEIYKQIIATGEAVRFERYYNDNQVEVWLDVTAKKVEDDLLVSFHDFTAIKKLQLQLEILVKELRQSNQNLEEFAYAASHDLQEPLRKIHTFANRLREDLSPQLNSVQSGMFQRIESAAHRMRNLIEDLLEYSEMGARESASNIVSLQGILENVVQDLEESINATKAVITINSLPEIKGDARQLRQLFQNLLSNALKYRKDTEPPRITVSYRMVNNPDKNLISVAGKIKGSYHLLEVIDNGIGFEPEHAEKIFQVFHRLHSRSEYEGTGIGLAIVQKVVANHKGIVFAEGTPNVGARFCVLLPA